MVIGRIVFALIMLALLMGAFYYFYLEQSGKLKRPKQSGGQIVRGEIIPDDQRGQPVELANQGTFASEKIPLERGVYKIEYQFPADVMTSVRIVGINNTSNKKLFTKTGAGSWVLHVDLTGFYVLQVEPTDDAARWKIDVKPLG
jgi:hypothetical protein